MIPHKARILVVEDENDIRDLMVLHLKRDGHHVEEAIDGEEALRKIGQNPYDLYIFDWMLPGMSGLDLTKALRGGKVKVAGQGSHPILMVTARVEASDIVVGLEAGADDYVTKPFEIPVFTARVRALLRRSVSSGGLEQPTPSRSNVIQVGQLAVNTDSHQIFCEGQEVGVTPSEFKLILALVENRGKVLTRSRLIDLVQGSGVNVVDRTVDTHVFGLRKKLGGCGDLIETVRGVGYRINLE